MYGATRTLPDAPVDAGAEFDVMIEVASYGALGQLVETLPAGFSYVSTTSSFEPNVVGQEVRFRLLGQTSFTTSFTYTVTASGTEGGYTFSGVVRNEDREEAQVEGDSSVTVEAVPPTHSATRSFSDSTVEPGTEFNVMIEAAGYGAVGQLVETLPAGFSYVSTTSSFEPNVDGREVGFRLLGQTSFSYTVTASDTAGSHTFSGVVKNEDRDERDVGGQSSVTVEAGAVTPGPSPTQPPAQEGLRATRTLPDAPVDAGAEFDVMIEVASYGALGQLVETLPAGFSYVSYTVTASGTEGGYTFSGVVRILQLHRHRLRHGGRLHLLRHCEGRGQRGSAGCRVRCDDRGGKLRGPRPARGDAARRVQLRIDHE
jgi:hypothetical protein